MLALVAPNIPCADIPKPVCDACLLGAGAGGWSAALVVPVDAGVIGVLGNATLSPAAGGPGGLPNGKSGSSVTLFRY